jgi:hypothetical protein
MCEVSDDVPKLTAAVLRGLTLVVRHHGANDEVVTALEKQVHSYADDVDILVWFKRIKFLLAYPMSKYLRNESPSAPDRVFRPTGALRGWMKARLNAYNRKNTHLWSSWLQAKRSALPLPPSVVTKTYDDHFNRLSSKDCGVEDTIGDILEEPTFRRVLEMVRKGLAKAFPKRADFTAEMPSTSACFENTRSAGGAYGQLATRVLPDHDDGLYRIHDSELISMTFYHHCRVNGEWRSNTVIETREHCGRDDWSRLGAEAQSDSAVRDEIGDNQLHCTIQAILEPLKVRVISKGEGLPYYQAKPLQKCLHGLLRDMPCFRLIGRTFCPTDLMDLMDHSSAEDEWFSIDYSAATDGLSAEYSRRILRHILQDVSDETRQLAEQVLGMHKLWYPDAKNKRLYRGMQQTGQLMGSPLSFPILCLANLGVYLLNTSDLHGERKLCHKERLKSVLVNGDDMIYRAPLALWSDHIAIGRDVGLEMSVGKAYTHRSYANINSVAVHYAPGETPWVVPFLNTGLFFGQNKVLADDKAEKTVKDSKSLGSERLNAMLKGWDVEGFSEGVVANTDRVVDGALPGRQAEILGMYIRENRQRIRIETTAVIQREGQKPTLFTRNLFLPISRGGMGVNRPADFKSLTSKIQRKVARSMFQSGHSAQHPLPGHPVEKVLSMKTRPWDDRAMDGVDYVFELRARRGVRGDNWRSDQILFSDSPYAVVSA